MIQRWLVLVMFSTFFGFSYAANEWHALVLSDTHLNPSTTSLTSFYDSDTGNADLWPSTQAELGHLVEEKKPRFVMLLGDLPAHHISSDNMKLADQQVFSMMDTVVASAGVPWFFVPGNNDSLEDDYYSFTKVDTKTGAKTNFVTEVAGGLPGEGFSSTCEEATGACVIDQGVYKDTPYFFGAYSAYPSADRKLRLIVLNTMLWLQERYVSDDGVPQNKAGFWEVQWFKDQLNEAKEAGEQVIVAMHIPSGLDSYKTSAYWKGMFQKSWEALISKYESTIALVVNGHTHMNALRQLQSVGKATLYALTVPGVTPLHGNNPGMDDLIWSTNEKGVSVWSDANVYAYSPDSQEWSVFQNLRSTYTPDCSYSSMMRCLSTLSQSTFLNTLDHYYALGAKGYEEPSEGWDAVNKAAWSHE